MAWTSFCIIINGLVWFRPRVEYKTTPKERNTKPAVMSNYIVKTSSWVLISSKYCMKLTRCMWRVLETLRDLLKKKKKRKNVLKNALQIHSTIYSSEPFLLPLPHFYQEVKCLGKKLMFILFQVPLHHTILLSFPSCLLCLDGKCNFFIRTFGDLGSNKPH